MYEILSESWEGSVYVCAGCVRGVCVWGGGGVGVHRTPRTSSESAAAVFFGQKLISANFSQAVF